MQYRLLTTFLLAGATYLTMARGGMEISRSIYPALSPLLGTYYLVVTNVLINVFIIPIGVLLVPQLFFYHWLLEGISEERGFFLLMFGGIFWGLAFSCREYFKLKKNQINRFTSNKSSKTGEPNKTRSKIFNIFWIGFLSVEVIFYLRVLISWRVGIKRYLIFHRFQETDCSLSSTIDNLLSLTPIHCIARKYFSHSAFFIDSSEGSEPSLIGAYFTSPNAVTFFGDCLLWGLIFAGLYFIAIKLWSLLRPQSGEPQTNLKDQSIP
jgi:hypothetical protein